MPTRAQEGQDFKDEALNDAVRKPDLPIDGTATDLFAHIQTYSGETPRAVLVLDNEGGWGLHGLDDPAKVANHEGNTRMIKKGRPNEQPDTTKQPIKNFNAIVAGKVNPEWIWVGGTPYKIC